MRDSFHVNKKNQIFHYKPYLCSNYLNISLVAQNLHQLLLGTFWTDDIVLISDKTTSNQTGTTRGTIEAIVVPMTILKRDEFRTTNTGNWTIAGETTSGKQFTKTIGTIGLIVTTGETFTSQTLLAMGAGEAFSVPWFILVRYTATGDDLITTKYSKS